MSETLNYVLRRPNDAADEIDRMRKQLVIALTALRRINSLAEKNVSKYAKEIAGEGLRRDVGSSGRSDG